MKFSKSKIKQMIDYMMNPSGYIDPDAMIKVDDGNGSYDKKYCELINELKQEYGGEDGYKEALASGRFGKRKIEEIVVNGIRCEINFMGTHYCGYIVINDTIRSISTEKLDYKPWGGFTVDWGFDCYHYNDMSFFGCFYGYPSKPDNLLDDTDSTISFKTRKFVLNELDKITKSIKRYLSKNPNNDQFDEE